MKTRSAANSKQATGTGRGSDQFVETRWSKVASAARGSGDQARQAKEELCLAYWQPIYSFLRRKGYIEHDSEDLTQQFFVHILIDNVFSRADRSKGRFRSFLLGSLKHFLIDEARRATTQKRRGQVALGRFDFFRAEENYLQEPDPSLTPEQLYDRRWAATLLDAAFRRLREDFVSAEQLDRFDALKSFLSDEPANGDYAQRALELGMTPKAVGVAVCRMRQRYRQLVRKMVEDTLTDAEDVDRELRDLFA